MQTPFEEFFYGHVVHWSSTRLSLGLAYLRNVLFDVLVTLHSIYTVKLSYNKLSVIRNKSFSPKRQFNPVLKLLVILIHTKIEMVLEKKYWVLFFSKRMCPIACSMMSPFTKVKKILPQEHFTNQTSSNWAYYKSSRKIIQLKF